MGVSIVKMHVFFKKNYVSNNLQMIKVKRYWKMTMGFDDRVIGRDG
jgi:hypothetical protein